MPVSKERLDELKKIIKEDYGKELSDKEVSEIGNGFVDYFSLLQKIKEGTNDDK